MRPDPNNAARDAISKAKTGAEVGAVAMDLASRLTRDVSAMAPSLGSRQLCVALFTAAISFAGRDMTKVQVADWLRKMADQIQQ
jgi:hypothetical protein